MPIGFQIDHNKKSLPLLCPEDGLRHRGERAAPHPGLESWLFRPLLLELIKYQLRVGLCRLQSAFTWTIQLLLKQHICILSSFSAILSLAWENYIPGWVQPFCPSLSQLPAPTSYLNAFVPDTISHTGNVFLDYLGGILIRNFIGTWLFDNLKGHSHKLYVSWTQTWVKLAWGISLALRSFSCVTLYTVT